MTKPKKSKWDFGVEITYDPEDKTTRERFKNGRKKRPPFIKPKEDAEKKRRPS